MVSGCSATRWLGISASRWVGGRVHLAQAHLDTWMANRRFTYPKETCHFIRWAAARKHAPSLAVTERRRRAGARVPHHTQQRWEDTRRLLQDDSLTLHDRVAGLLVLLYAQSAPDTARLTTGDVRVGGTGVKIMLWTVPVTLPGPMAILVSQLATTQPGHAAIGRPPADPWLLPGGRPGHPLPGKRIGERLINIGLHPRQDRATALLLSLPSCPPRSLPASWGSASPSRRNGNAHLPATG